jgi:glucose-6-phosphate isomerase
LQEVHALDAMLAYAEQVRADPAITDVVNIGIGGSTWGRRWRCWRWMHLCHSRQTPALRVQRGWP